MSAALAIQNSTGIKNVLPLILNSKEEVLSTYPIIHGLAYREFNGAEAVADEIAAMVRPETEPMDGSIRVIVESVHTGRQTYLRIPPRASVKWLGTTAAAQTGLRDSADVGAFEKMNLRWVPVDASLLDKWNALPVEDQFNACGMFWREGDQFVISYNEYDRLDQFAVTDGTVFHLYGIPTDTVEYL
jgi:hypothetical protein